MKITIQNQEIVKELAKIPVMNYGQMQRWEDFVPLTYTATLTIESFKTVKSMTYLRAKPFS